MSLYCTVYSSCLFLPPHSTWYWNWNGRPSYRASPSGSMRRLTCATWRSSRCSGAWVRRTWQSSCPGRGRVTPALLKVTYYTTRCGKPFLKSASSDLTSGRVHLDVWRIDPLGRLVDWSIHTSRCTTCDVRRGRFFKTVFNGSSHLHLVWLMAFSIFYIFLNEGAYAKHANNFCKKYFFQGCVFWESFGLCRFTV